MKNIDLKHLNARIAQMLLCVCIGVAVPALAIAKGKGATSNGSLNAPPSRSTGLNSTPYNRGKIARDMKAENSFRRAHPCPSNGKSVGPCPGYYIFFVKPQKKGGEVKLQWRKSK